MKPVSAMETQEETCAKSYFRTSEVARWVDFCGLSRILNSGEWLTLQGLMKTEARVVGLEDERWAEGLFGGWFVVRVRSELTLYTGLTERRQTDPLLSLQDKWNLIDVSMGRGKRPTRVNFVKSTLDSLGAYCIPRLRPYQGGIRGQDPLPYCVYLWIRSDLEGFGARVTGVNVAKLTAGVGADETPSLERIREILTSGRRGRSVPLQR
jgi:hypothetical protein